MKIKLYEEVTLELPSFLIDRLPRSIVKKFGLKQAIALAIFEGIISIELDALKKQLKDQFPIQ